MRLVNSIVLFLVCSASGLRAQTNSVSGIVKDFDQQPIPGLVVKLIPQSDTTQVYYGLTNSEGSFKINFDLPGEYLVKIDQFGFEPYGKVHSLIDGQNFLPEILLPENSKQLGEVLVQTYEVRVSENGDTTEYNADAFKTNPDATAEDLILKMPGIVSEDNTIKVNGKEVEVVLVDGKPFFGDDPTTTLKNLPAEMVDKVQVYDKASDQSEFTGFKDGEEKNAINIVTKSDKNIGQFGRTYVGYGTNNRYTTGGTYNYFNQDTRFSVIGLSNNINEQNFSFSDIMGVMQNSGASMGPPGPNSAIGNFFSNEQNGNTKTNAIGLNYIDTWGEKFEFSGSYFFNYSDNLDSSNTTRNYFSENGLIYRQNSISNNINLNHRFNGRLEYAIDSTNEIILTSGLTAQTYRSDMDMNSSNFYIGSYQNNSISETFTTKAGFNLNNDILYRHKFKKTGRTFSINFSYQYSGQDGNQDYYSLSTIDSLSERIIDQNNTTVSTSSTYGVNISYTEAIGNHGQLLISYRPQMTFRNLDKGTYNESGGAQIQDSSLSNLYSSVIHSERGGLKYQFNRDKITFSFGMDAQNIVLTNEQALPYSDNTSTSFFAVLPSANLLYNISKTKSLHLDYQSQTNTPSVSQLQNVIDVSNPLLISSGNVELAPSYENSLMTRFSIRKPSKGRNFFIFLRGRYSSNYISNSTSIIANDTIINGTMVNAGSQFTKPVNLDQYFSADVFSVYSIALRKLKSNLNFDAGYNHSYTPAMLQNQLYHSQNKRIRLGIQLSSNVSEYLDFSIGYSGNLNFAASSNQSTARTYMYHDLNATAYYAIKKRVILSAEYDFYVYNGLSDGYDQSYHLLNASLGYKFLKNQSLELKITSFDLLNQNTSIRRTVTETYTEDGSTVVLQRYFMLHMTYTFKNFKSGGLENNFPGDMPPPNKNMRPLN
ncbi:MAG: TonB-dependent receptor [Bacteroidetes bacterium]|nr:TonB-dependent receptor [Bacteroidota bacterium]